MATRLSIQKVLFVGVQFTLLGIVCFQLVALEAGPFALFLIGLGFVAAGVLMTVNGVIASEDVGSGSEQ